MQLTMAPTGGDTSFLRVHQVFPSLPLAADLEKSFHEYSPMAQPQDEPILLELAAILLVMVGRFDLSLPRNISSTDE